jgi:diguanylate cyclase (GGDEF)-like protein
VASGTLPKLQSYPETETRIPVYTPDQRPAPEVPERGILFAPLHAGCVLVRLDGQAAGQVVLLNKSELVVGRTHSADILLDDVSTSREHARLICKPLGWSLQDMGSKNGTRVNGQHIDYRELQPGDTVEFGRLSKFVFSVLPKLRESESASMFDALTGAYSARYFDARLHAEVSFARRHHRECSLILIEPHRFADVIQTYGASAAENLLQQIAATCSIGLRGEDICARQQAARFAILLRDIDVTGTFAVQRRLLSRVNALKPEFLDKPINITAHAACSTLFECPWPLATGLLQMAEHRLEAAKRASGR